MSAKQRLALRMAGREIAQLRDRCAQLEAERDQLAAELAQRSSLRGVDAYRLAVRLERAEGLLRGLGVDPGPLCQPAGDGSWLERSGVGAQHTVGSAW